MSKIKNTSFFAKPASPTTLQEQLLVEEKKTVQTKVGIEIEDTSLENIRTNRFQLRKRLMEDVNNVVDSLKTMGMLPLASEVIRLYNKVLEEKFSVAFVGEFSLGKSTLINRLLGLDILPVSDLPTTALLTRITYGQPKMVVLGAKGDKLKELPLSKQSWEGLTVSNFGEKEPEGRVILSIPNKWLGKNSIDILDTPGAGDLEVKRAKVVGQALLCADAAIITISATHPLSLTEQSFIKQKILSTKVPFVALAITKLDEIKKEERDSVIRYIKKKLKSLKIDMPIVIADDSIDLPSDEFEAIVGVDKLKALLKIWLLNENRVNLTEQWLISNVLNVLSIANKILLQQKQIIQAKDDEREKLIAQRNLALSKVHGLWQALRDQMVERCRKCVAEFSRKVEENGEAIIERLQHEVDRVPSAKAWVEKEYSYRVKTELASVSLALDSFIARQISCDVRWLNSQLSAQFKAVLNVELEGLGSKDSFLPDVNEKDIHLDDLAKKRTQTTITTVAVTLCASLALASCGGFIPLATLGLGTGANVIANTVFSKKAEKQKEQVKEIIVANIPPIIKEASNDCIVKIKILYNDIISEALTTETKWMQTQRSLIREANKPQTEEAAKRLEMYLENIETLKKRLNNKSR